MEMPSVDDDGRSFYDSMISSYKIEMKSTINKGYSLIKSKFPA